MSEIKSNDDLQAGKHYHCFDWQTGRHSIQECFQNPNGDPKHMGRGRIWACDENNQALTKWRIFTLEIPNTGSINLCCEHHGSGFKSDCAVCNNG